MTVYCIGMHRCPYWPECVDPDRCLLDEEAEEIMKEAEQQTQVGILPWKE